MSNGLKTQVNPEGYLFNDCTFCNKNPVSTKWPGDDKKKWITRAAIKRHTEKWQGQHGTCFAPTVGSNEYHEPTEMQHTREPGDINRGSPSTPGIVESQCDVQHDGWTQDESGTWWEKQDLEEFLAGR